MGMLYVKFIDYLSFLLRHEWFFKVDSPQRLSECLVDLVLVTLACVGHGRPVYFFLFWI